MRHTDVPVGPETKAGIGTRMMWHPRKAAFRAGHVTISVWDEVNIGTYSAAFGLNALAGGFSGVALGEESQAPATHSAAFGTLTSATGAGEQRPRCADDRLGERKPRRRA